MSQDIPQHTNKRRYILTAIAASFFLLILPSIVLAIASNMTGIDIIAIGEENPLVPYKVLEQKNIGSTATLWIRTDKGTSHEEMKQIVRKLVESRYRGQPKMMVYFFRRLDPETNLPKQPGVHGSDNTYVWTPSDGIRKMK